MSLMGVDLGISKVAMSTINAHGRHVVDIYESPSTNRVAQLDDLREIVRTMAHRHGVGYVFIEDTLIGNNRKYSIKLAQSMGAVLSGLVYWDGLVHTVNVSTWKKSLLGSGNANKGQIRNWVDTHHPNMAAHCNGDQDAFDATCIALYGQSVVDLSHQLMEDV